MARGPRSDRFADAAGSFANFDKNRQIHALFRQIDGLFPSFCDLFDAPFPSPIRPPSLPSRAHPSRIRNISRRTPACAPQMRADAGKCARGSFWRIDFQRKMTRSARPARLPRLQGAHPCVPPASHRLFRPMDSSHPPDSQSPPRHGRRRNEGERRKESRVSGICRCH